jgi:outer membrane protein assembly factor BamB
MGEMPGEPPGEPPDSHDEEQLPQEPYPHEELPFGAERHAPAADEPAAGDGEEEHEPLDSADEPPDEHGDVPPDEHGEVPPDEHGDVPPGLEDDADEEHHTVEETELAGPLGEDTALHLIDDDEAESEFDYHSFDEADYESLEEQIHSPEELRERRLEERAARRRAGRQRLAALIAAIVVIVIIIVVATSGGGGKPPAPPVALSAIGATGGGSPGYLAAGSSASAVPGNILIADRNNKRLLAVTPAGQPVWSHNLAGPSDAYPSSTAHSIVVTEHGGAQVFVLSVDHGSITYHYGHSNVPGSAPNRLHDPSAAQYLPDGRIVIADKANCRVLEVRPPVHHAIVQYGTPSTCVHKPPTSFGYPDGAFPTTGGGLVVTELTPAWIDLISKSGKLIKDFQVVGLTSPYAANETPNGDYVATNYAHPGAVVEFDSSGNVVASYEPKSGPGELDFPTLAVVLSNGNWLISDARNDRVIVVDPSTKQIVWQYGHTGKPGNGNGYLHTPDSAVAVPVPSS